MLVQAIPSYLAPFITNLEHWHSLTSLRKEKMRILMRYWSVSDQNNSVWAKRCWYSTPPSTCFFSSLFVRITRSGWIFQRRWYRMPWKLLWGVKNLCFSSWQLVISRKWWIALFVTLSNWVTCLSLSMVEMHDQHVAGRGIRMLGSSGWFVIREADGFVNWPGTGLCLFQQSLIYVSEVLKEVWHDS